MAINKHDFKKNMGVPYNEIIIYSYGLRKINEILHLYYTLNEFVQTFLRH